MSRIEVTRKIRAPVEVVFDTVAYIDNFSKAVPEIVRTEILSETKSGVGTRFRETRSMRGREHSVELEVTEFEKNRMIRIVADDHGAVWDTVFSVNEVDGVTTLALVMDARPHTLLSRLLTPMMKGMIVSALKKDMDAVKNYCEK